jgi:hypothetical protein
MPSRKQRRRRAKQRRHEYEYVYVDDSGEEVPAPEAEDTPRRQRSERGRNGSSRFASKRAPREYGPPSWQKAVRRSLLFFPLFFIVFSLVNKHSAIGPRLLASIAYSLLFIPLTYMMDRTAYRSYLRRSGKQPGSKR